MDRSQHVRKGYLALCIVSMLAPIPFFASSASAEENAVDLAGSLGNDRAACRSQAEQAWKMAENFDALWLTYDTCLEATNPTNTVAVATDPDCKVGDDGRMSNDCVRSVMELYGKRPIVGPTPPSAFLEIEKILELVREKGLPMEVIGGPDALLNKQFDGPAISQGWQTETDSQIKIILKNLDRNQMLYKVSPQLDLQIQKNLMMNQGIGN